jgi:hypothetical protein
VNWDFENVDDERRAALLRSVNAYSDALGTRFPGGPLPVWGVGIVNLYGEPRALLLVGDYRWIRRYPYELYPPGDLPNSELPYPPDFTITNREDFAGALERSRGWLNTLGVSPENLTGGILPQDTEFLFVGRPRALGANADVLASGDPIRSAADPKERGTVGPPIERVDDQGQTRQGFLTAGHVVSGGVGSVIEAIHASRWTRTSHTAVGTVAAYVDPFDSPGVAAYDVAVIDNLDGLPPVDGPPRGKIASIPADLPDEVPLNIYCGVSGLVDNAQIIAALRDVGRGPRRWKDCWAIAPSGATVPGDSGSAAIVDDASRDVAGLVVGGSYDQRGSSSVPLVQYVQDLESLDRGFLAARNVTLA